MAVDVSRVIGAVVREIVSCERDGRPARRLVATREYDTTREDLWDALTSRERIPRWFLPVSGDLHLGGRYQIQGNASGEITACEPPARLALTWGMHGDVSWVEVTLSPVTAERTLLRLEHTARVPEEMWSQFGPGGVGIGWDSALLGLDQHLLRAGAGVDPQSAAAWLRTAEGKSFIERSSDAWVAAWVASGAEPAAAAEAGARVAAMYLMPDDAPAGG